MITIVGIVLTDLLVGIALGLAVAIIQILWNNYRTPYDFDPSKYVKGEAVTIHLAQDVTFLNKASVLHTLNQLPNGSHVIIDGSITKSIHPDILEIIEDFSQHAKSCDIQVELKGFDRKQAYDPVVQFGRVVLDHPAPTGKGKRLMNFMLDS